MANGTTEWRFKDADEPDDCPWLERRRHGTKYWERVFLEEVVASLNAFEDAMTANEMAWGLIANAGEGNWMLEAADWQVAAIKWRDNYHRLLTVWLGRKEPTDAV